MTKKISILHKLLELFNFVNILLVANIDLTNDTLIDIVGNLLNKIVSLFIKECYFVGI